MNVHKPRIRRPGSRQRKGDKREREISAIVGRNMKALRAMTGISQSLLADKIGVTFQQVQKYENGANRVSAPKLLLMAEIFNVPISAFFSNTGLEAPEMPTFGKSGVRAAKMVDALPPKMQGAALRILQSLSQDGSGG